MSYGQPGTKRQKVREIRVDNVDYFQGIDRIEYNNMASPSECSSYRYYNTSERVHSKTMEEWLKYSISLTEFRNNGADSHGRPSLNRPWDDNTNSIDNHKRCIKAFFDFCTKLGIRYWTAFDTDLVPHTENWDENKTHWEEIVEFIQEMTQKVHVRLLWLAPDLHSHPRYASGSFTSTDAITFVQAAAQIKRCLEMSQRLNGECFLLWPHREGYDAVYHTDVARELKLFAKLLKLTAEYRDRLNYRCQLLIMPYYGSTFGRHYCCNSGGYYRRSRWFELDLVRRYMWDVTSCLYFLKSYNLERNYKVCAPPGHHMYMANVYNMLGGVFITNDVDNFDSKKLTLMMKCIVDMGNPPPGGISLILTPRRDSDLRDLVTAYMKYADAIAKGLRTACALIAEQTFSKHLQQRYSTYYSGFGSRLVSSDVTMEECEEYYKKNQSINCELTSSKCEQMDIALQRRLDACDHI